MVYLDRGRIMTRHQQGDFIPRLSGQFRNFRGQDIITVPTPWRIPVVIPPIHADGERRQAEFSGAHDRFDGIRIPLSIERSHPHAHFDFRSPLILTRHADDKILHPVVVDVALTNDGIFVKALVTPKRTFKDKRSVFFTGHREVQGMFAIDIDKRLLSSLPCQNIIIHLDIHHRTFLYKNPIT